MGEFQGSNELDGFFVQEEDSDADSDPATSEGLFVYAPGATQVNVGDVVSVTGRVTEYFDLTELTDVTGIEVCSTDAGVTPATLTLPVSPTSELERYENMLVRSDQTLTIVEFFNFDRYGEIVLSSSGRQYQSTHWYAPGSTSQVTQTAENEINRIILDDGRSDQNPDVVRHPNGNPFSLSNRFRGGDTLTEVEGVLNYSFSEYRIQPTTGATYHGQNPRPSAPAAVGGNLNVASFNVLNYFTTLDIGNNQCGPAANRQDCRGANTLEEFERQHTKIILALQKIDADVFGLIELENAPDDTPLDVLLNGGVITEVDDSGVPVATTTVQGLNDMIRDFYNPMDIYDYIATGAIESDPASETDVIRVGFIYKPAMVTPIGSFEVLNDADNSQFDDSRSRPALAQTFEENATGERFTVVVNHFKSKGSDCGGAPDDDPVQGNCNGTRTAAAATLRDWLATDPTGSGDPDFLIIGDLNSYKMEDPITALQTGGYTDLLAHFDGPLAYTYVFDGQLGYLDYALANSNLLDQVTGATGWSINTDEPDILDYDMSFKPDPIDALYAPDAYRASDHDPVIVGLSLRSATPLIASSDTYSVTEDRDAVSLDVLQNDIGSTLVITRVGVTSSGGSAAADDDRDHIIYTPAADFFGQETFTYTIAISGTSEPVSTATVTITVTAINDAPTLDDLNDLNLEPNEGEQTINLTGISTGADNEDQTISITATSGDPTLVPNPVVTYTSPDETGSLSFTPVANQTGTTTVTVTIQDDGGTDNGGEDTTAVTFVVNIAQGGGTTLPNGVAAGDVTTSSAVLWTRSTALGEVTFEYSTDSTFATGTQAVGATVTDPLIPVKVPVEGLTPGTRYYYRVTDASGSSASGQFRMAAEVGTTTGLRFGVSGDWQEPPPYPSLDNVDERDLDFFVQHSDNIYADISTPAVPVEQATTLEQFRTKYTEVYSTVLGFNTMRDLRASTAILAIIDDHELTDNFAGGARRRRVRTPKPMSLPGLLKHSRTTPKSTRMRCRSSRSITRCVMSSTRKLAATRVWMVSASSIATRRMVVMQPCSFLIHARSAMLSFRPPPASPIP
ncbi:MAG: ExeM/NucH family extracellular endonuclease [Chloroflexaceae bacterium]|nr:ExeM/NucH family extracellular endonuclease [Chloroflexaceae bacterium]